MYKIKAKQRRGNKYRKFLGRRRVKALYFADWDSACSFCVTAGLRLKQISIA